MDEAMLLLPAVPMRFEAGTAPVLSSRNVFICATNGILFVLLLLNVWFGYTGDMYIFPGLMAWMGIVYLVYLVSMHIVINNKIGYHLGDVPKLRDEGELTAYVTKMQRAQMQVNFSVVCSHIAARSKKVSGPPKTGKSTPTVTYTSSHPFEYATSTDVSTLSKNWQQPAGGGGEDGSLGTGFVAVVASQLRWTAAKGITADRIKAEKERLYEENKHRDTHCSVTVGGSLPGQHDALYAPPDAKFTKRLPRIVELLLVLFGLGGPLYFYYVRKLSRLIEHKVHKTIYIAGHAPAEGGGGGGGAIDIASDASGSGSARVVIGARTS